MTTDLSILLVTAASIGFVHTVFGPDHYLPFVAMAKAGDWSRRKMFWVTVLCGLGHVASSVAIGLLGVWLGWTVGGMESFESSRGNWAAWGLIGFGLAYGLWGLNRAIRNRPHRHVHAHADGTVHVHGHGHRSDHAHAHTESSNKPLTPWVLFTIFVLGPCEPLIPILMIPASQHSWWGLGTVTAVFGVVTITTMTALAFALLYGMRLVPLGRLERWSHALAGLTLFACGGAIKWLGL